MQKIKIIKECPRCHRQLTVTPSLIDIIIIRNGKSVECIGCKAWFMLRLNPFWDFLDTFGLIFVISILAAFCLISVWWGNIIHSISYFSLLVGAVIIRRFLYSSAKLVELK